MKAVLFSRPVLALALAGLISGCAMDRAYRTAADAGSGRCDDAQKCNAWPAVEFKQFTVGDLPVNQASGSYILSFVEFDDQGWFHDPAQKTSLFKALETQRKEQPDTKFLIVTYAHGWKHNAGFGFDGQEDPNVQAFRNLLERLALLEQAQAKADEDKTPGKVRKARKVVGVYLGWRGASWTLPFIENSTFWTRKNAGERVGDRSAKQLLMELSEYRNFLNDGGRFDSKGKLVAGADRDRLAGPEDTQLILIGHSFGGMLMYHALHTGLMERALKIEPDPDMSGNHLSYRYDMAKSFGDFVLLVNPAFEGATYEPLAVVAQSRCYSPSQRPVMAIVTSKGDWATKYAFPAGRLYTMGQSAKLPGERETVMNTVGHLDRYITHDLVYDKKGPVPEEPKPLLPATMQNAQKAVEGEGDSGGLRRPMLEEKKGEPGLEEENVDPALKEKRVVYKYKGATLVTRKKPNGQAFPYNNPYLVLSADKALIKDHNDIWNENFVDFMISFVHTELMRPVPDEEMNNPVFHTRHCPLYGQDSMSKDVVAPPRH
jgi:hypothetical protein